ncbi:methylcrotonoyl-CoA carboxylase beta chain, mitochondrial [Strongylocentrotus purpuratus]|uniref:methylcrotonoyl-CoA carboxylase n=1 Tax=Strongylocentrotus purpuratus TaxID=7668 RepID=A0A7M7PJF1_STRPU|nr:methylcrotonoyl-CoA carboxylase beta chain, mitochondrial [Strongylocentrotus purpuratus]
MTTFMQMLCKIRSPRLNVFRPCSSSKFQKTPTAPWQCTRFRTCSSAASKSSETPFVPLEGDVDTGHVDFQTNFVHNYQLNEQLQEILGIVHAGGGEKSMKKHTELNKKIFVRDRLRLLLDDYDNEFLELSSLAGWDMEYGRIPAASNVCGIGKVRGTWCSVSASDATIKGGTSYPITVKKQLRMQEICQQNSLPAIYIIDSGGAFLPLQSEIFPDKNHGGRVFYNEAILSAQGISQIAIVCGSCTAGGAYVPTMADEAIIMHKIGTIFLAGPPLVHAATGERVSAEDLGGATLHCRVSGCTDHFASTEEEGFTMGRDSISTLNVTPPSDPTQWNEPLYSQDELLGLVSKTGEVKGQMRKILARLVDGSRFHEFKKLYGPTLITGFAFVRGHLVGITANDGELSHDAATKGAHFAELCQHRNIPLIFLQSVSEDESWAKGDHELMGETIKARAKMAAVVACMTVPKITVMVGSSYGSSSFAMCSSSFDPRFVFMWPNARVGLQHPEEMATLAAQESGKPEDEEKLREKFQKQSTAVFASSRMWNDGVIAPEDTRNVLSQCLSIVSQQACNQPFAYQNRAVLRM